MRIMNNIMALNAHRQLMANQTGSARSMEKLSSGLRINRAGDDAAGLAISEKMRGQIRGLNQAERNAQDGISLIQTAEGALNETHSILQRMRELAVQSASDTNTAVDRNEIQKEVDQLAQELTRIADTTEFNTQNLLGGGLDVVFHIGANEGQNISLAINAMDANALGVEGVAYSAESDITGLEIISRTGEALTVSFETASEASASTTAAFVPADDTTSTPATITVTLGTDEDSAINATHADVLAALQSVAADAGILLRTVEGTGDATDFDGSASVGGTAPTGGPITWAPDADASKLVGIDVSTQLAADGAITTINNAIETVSAERSKLGAMQNRLEHTIANLGASAENLQAAESRIRDVDMAAEMMAFTKYQILQQASTAMLAQANMAPQSVLQLLG
ncbi:MAG: flagellin [Firmicutes bacterium]|nr:flagellin [Bacillota bacterium]